MNCELTYESAILELEDIARKIENDECNLDEVTVLLKRSRQLITFCKDKLTRTDNELKEILSED